MTFISACEKDDTSDDENDNGQNGHTVVYGSVTDIDGNKYETVMIDGTEWMAENLKVSHYSNGDPVALVLNDSAWENTTEGAAAVYPHHEFQGLESASDVTEAYGKLYNWAAATDTRNICPDGWHVPSEVEWTQMSDYFKNQVAEVTSGNLGNKLKSCRQDDSPLGGHCDTKEHPRWNGHGSEYGTDDFGFAALPGGVRDEEGAFAALGLNASWWTSTGAGSDGAFVRLINFDSGNFHEGVALTQYGLSIRCVKN